MARHIRLDELPEKKASIKDKAAYERLLEELQLTALKIQQTYFHERRRGIVVFEGWDAAGKGGAIRRLTEGLDPRGIHVWSIGKPDPVEQGRHYLYRFWARLPEPGTLAIFDRSWYGRVLVEAVEKLIGKTERNRAYGEINAFERMLAEDGVRIVKIFLHITPEEQLRRFRERLTNPYKRWKFTGEDIRNRARWGDYQKAAEKMFRLTSAKEAPWHAVFANRKWYARIKSLEIITRELSRGLGIEAPALDPALQRAAAEQLGIRLEG